MKSKLISWFKQHPEQLAILFIYICRKEFIEQYGIMDALDVLNKLFCKTDELDKVIKKYGEIDESEIEQMTINLINSNILQSHSRAHSIDIDYAIKLTTAFNHNGSRIIIEQRRAVFQNIFASQSGHIQAQNILKSLCKNNIDSTISYSLVRFVSILIEAKFCNKDGINLSMFNTFISNIISELSTNLQSTYDQIRYQKDRTTLQTTSVAMSSENFDLLDQMHHTFYSDSVFNF